MTEEQKQQPEPAEGEATPEAEAEEATAKSGEPSPSRSPFAWAMAAGKAAMPLAGRRRAERQAIEAAITTPVAQPAPAPRRLVSRRMLILGGFWSGLGLAIFGVLGAPFDFLFPRNVKGFGGPVPVARTRIPAAGENPRRIVEGKFWLVNLEPGVTPNGEKTDGGLLALWQKCPHLGCTVPWRADFVFGGRKGWFRCPCHGSTYTKEGGVRVFGPAPRSMDVFPIQEVKEDGSIVVQTGIQFAGTGSTDNPGEATEYNF